MALAKPAAGKTAWSDWENQNVAHPADAPIAPAGTLATGGSGTPGPVTAGWEAAAGTPSPTMGSAPVAGSSGASAATTPTLGTSGGSSPIAPAGVVTNGAGQQPAAPTTVADSFQQALVKRLNPEAVSSSSASVAPAIQANNLREQRGFERNRGLLAERAAANGQDLSGGFETNLMGLAQDRAGREGSYAGQAVQHANDLQNDNMTSALGQAGSYLSGNASRDLQRYGMDQANALGQGDLDLRGRLGEGGLNLGLLQALLGNDQFGKSLAQNGAQFGAGLDQSGLIALLSGLH